jgi:hypothetical protein
LSKNIFPTLVKIIKTPKFSRNTFVAKNGNFPQLSKYFYGPRKSEKFQKNSKNYPKIPTLTRKGRKCEKCVGNSGKSWEISGINSKIF